jgi:hypothetical protein
MTMVHPPRTSDLERKQIDGKLLWAVLVCLVSVLPTPARGAPVHWHHAGAMPPGAIGRQRLIGRGPLSGVCLAKYCQPVEIQVPAGADVAPLNGASEVNKVRDNEAENSRLLVGMQIGPVYRLKVTNIPEHAGLELFPTIELIDRLYPPPGQSLRFPIPVELTLNELLMASEGQFITRVIYLENPKTALPLAENGKSTRWIEARPGEDPLVMADHLGRPMAIVRLGGRVPDSGGLDPAFHYHAPPVIAYDQTDK